MSAELEVFVQTRWRCPACRRSYSRHGTAVNHRAVCTSEPENRSCRTCAHNPEPWYIGYHELCEGGEEPINPLTGKAKLNCPSWVAAAEEIEAER